MREHREGLRLLIWTALQVAPGRLLLAMTQTLGSMLTALTPWWAGLLVAAASSSDVSRAATAIGALIITTALGWLLGLLGGEARVTLAERVSFALDRRIAVLTASIPTLTHFEHPDYADQVQILRRNRGLLGGGLSSMLHGIDHVVSAVVVLVVASAVDPRLLLVGLTALPPLLAARLRYRWTETGDQESATPSRLADHYLRAATDPAVGMEIRVFGLRPEITKRLRSAMNRRDAPVFRAAASTARLRLAEDVAFALVLTAVLAWLVVTGHGGSSDTARSVAVAVVAARQIQTVIVQAVHGFGGEGGFLDTLRMLRRVLWLETFAASPVGHTVRTAPPDGFADGISLNRVSFTYPGAPAPSLREVDLSLPAGTVVALVGENGAGKTTLAKLLTGMYTADSGVIAIDRTPLERLDLDAWRSRTTAAFQDHARFELTVQHAVGIGLVDHADRPEAVHRAVARAGADALVGSLPEGLATRLGSRWLGGHDLSGGQWQTVALARSQMRTRPLLQILDEPAAALDAHAEHDLFRRFAAASAAGREQGGITLLITHRFTSIQAADLIVVLHLGEVVEVGSDAQLMARGGRYAELYALQAAGYR